MILLYRTVERCTYCGRESFQIPGRVCSITAVGGAWLQNAYSSRCSLTQWDLLCVYQGHCCWSFPVPQGHRASECKSMLSLLLNSSTDQWQQSYNMHCVQLGNSEQGKYMSVNCCCPTWSIFNSLSFSAVRRNFSAKLIFWDIRRKSVFLSSHVHHKK